MTRVIPEALHQELLDDGQELEFLPQIPEEDREETRRTSTSDSEKTARSSKNRAVISFKHGQKLLNEAENSEEVRRWKQALTPRPAI